MRILHVIGTFSSRAHRLTANEHNMTIRVALGNSQLQIALQTLLRVTHFLSSAENLKHFCFGCLIRLFCFSFFFVILAVFGIYGVMLILTGSANTLSVSLSIHL